MKQPLSEDENVLNALIETSKDLGIDLEAAISKLGLSEKLLSSPGQFVASHLFNCLLEAIAKDYHCHDMALRIASKQPEPQLGLPTSLMALSSNFRSGLNKASEYSAFYHDTHYWQHDVCEDHVRLFKASTPYSSQYFHQRNLLGTAHMFTLIGNLSNHLWHPNKLSFSFPDPGAKFSQTFHDFFGCELLFDQDEDSITFPLEYLEYSIASSDPSLLRGMELHIKSLQEELLQDRSFIERARLLMDERLRFAHCGEAELAHYMAVSTEQLRVELRLENVTFNALFEQQICKRAAEYTQKYHAPSKLIAAALMPENKTRLLELMALAN